MLDGALKHVQAPASLLARLSVAQVFLASGLTKLRDWDITLSLFMDEYKAPLVPPEVATWMGTCGELGLPVLLVLGRVLAALAIFGSGRWNVDSTLNHYTTKEPE